jgi:hypothetical protein
MKPEELKIQKEQLKMLKSNLQIEFYLFLEFARQHFPLEMEGRNGCYITLSSKKGNYPSCNDYTFKLGAVSKDKKEKYSCLSNEKKKRLLWSMNVKRLGWTNCNGYDKMMMPWRITTSYQTRNPEAPIFLGDRKKLWGKWGGAIYVSSHPSIKVISCSGFPEILDECLCLWLAKRLFGLSIHDLLDIVIYRQLWKEDKIAPDIVTTIKYLDN